MKIALVIAFIIAAAAIGFGQNKTVDPTPTNTLDTRVLPTEPVAKPLPPVGVATPAQTKMLAGDQAIARLAQINFQNAIAQMQADADDVKKVNGWPAGTPFCMDTLAFAPCPSVGPVTPATAAPKPAAPAAPAAPAVKK